MGIYNDIMFPTSPLNREKPHTAGMSAAERAAYNKKTGGNLKAPQPEGGSRKESYCARSAGIKKCKDPDKMETVQTTSREETDFKNRSAVNRRLSKI